MTPGRAKTHSPAGGPPGHIVGQATTPTHSGYKASHSSSIFEILTQKRALCTLPWSKSACHRNLPRELRVWGGEDDVGESVFQAAKNTFTSPSICLPSVPDTSSARPGPHSQCLLLRRGLPPLLNCIKRIFFPYGGCPRARICRPTNSKTAAASAASDGPRWENFQSRIL